MAIATGVAGAGAGIAKFFEGRKMQKEGEKFIENFEWVDPTNPYEDLSVSTAGADYMAEQNNISSATAVEALRSGGSRAILGGLGRVEANTNRINRESAVNLDEQQKVIDRMAAQQNVANQAIIEKRQTEELAGYGTMVNVGMGLKNQGISNIVNGVGSVAQGLAGLPKNPAGEQKPEVSSVNGLESVGTTYSNSPVASLPWLK